LAHNTAEKRIVTSPHRKEKQKIRRDEKGVCETTHDEGERWNKEGDN